MWRWWFWLAESNTCDTACCAALPCIFSHTLDAKRNVIWREKGSIWRTATLSWSNGDHLSLPSERRRIRRYDTTGCLHRKQRAMTVAGFFLNRNEGHLSNTGQAALSPHHQCQKIRHRKLECGPDWVWYPLIQKATLKNIAANELWVAELKCFPWMALTVARGTSQFLLQGSLCLDLLHDWLLSISWHQSAPLGCLQQSPQWWRKWQRVLTDQNQTPRSLWPDANAQIVLVTPAQWHAHTNSMYVPVN